LLARLGAGGMGVVYLGTGRAGTTRTVTTGAGTTTTVITNVAIKVLRPELADDADFRARFRREVTALSRVRGLCTVQVIEADVDAERPYLVTEYVAGPTLAQWVTEHGPLGAGMLRALAAGLAEALAAIHAAGVVHRDLKPGNVLLAADGPRVIDFGIAQTLDATSVTRTGMSVGSPGYMAPEQVRGKSGPAADIFSWGLTVGYAASGQPPFGTGPADAIFYRVLHDEPDIAAVPGPLKPLVTAALAKTPEDRPTATQLLAPELTTAEPGPERQAVSAGSVGPALDAMLARTWLVPAQPPPPATVIRLPTGQPDGPVRRARRGSLTGRYPFLLPAAGAAAVLIGVVAGLTAGHSGQAGPAGTPVALADGGTIDLTPFGTCGAGCPAFVANPDAEVSGDASGDLQWLLQTGYTPIVTSQWTQSYGSLNVIIARPFGSTDKGLRAFFFSQGSLIGEDVPGGDGSASVQEFPLAYDEIDLRYQLHGTSASVADVRFQLLNNRLVMLDPMPPQPFRG
jgi:eukaryotic-like serine/threonine-protein kinase